MNKRMLHAAQTVLTEPVEADGIEIELYDTVNAPLRGLCVCGKSTQDATPTPENPVEIVSVGYHGSIELEITGENLIESLNGAKSGDVLKSSIGGVNNSDYSKSKLYELPQFGSKRILSYVATHVSGYTLYFRTFDSDKNVLNDSSSKAFCNTGEIGCKHFIPISEKAKYYAIVSGYQYTCIVEKIMLNIGNTALRYEPYSHQSITIYNSNSLPGIPVASNGNYTDADGQQWICDEVDYGRGVYVQRVGEFLYGGETIYTNTMGGYLRFQVSAKLGNVKSGNSNGFCNIFEYSYIPIGSNNKNNHVNAHKSGNIYFRCDQVSTADECKVLLQEKHMKVLYELDTPIEIPLTDEEVAAYKSLHSNYPATVITNTEDAFMKANCLKIGGGGYLKY